MSEKRIVCFGDSNTWGYDPAAGCRYGDEIRWTKLLERKLGSGWRVVEEGQNGRTIACPDPWEWGTKCGLDTILPVVESQVPLEALVIMLGTNDLKAKFRLPVPDIAGSLQNMLKQVRSHCRYYLGLPDLKILIVAPPAIGSGLARSRLAPFYDGDAVSRSKELAGWYELVAGQFGCDFLNAAEAVSGGDTDAIHLSPEGHRLLADLVYEKLAAMLQTEQEAGGGRTPQGKKSGTGLSAGQKDVIPE